MASYSQPFPYQCPNGHSGELAVWLVIDGEDRPDLLHRAASGELTPPRCPECGRDGVVQGRLSLLLRRPDRRPEILFASADPQDADRVREQAQISAMMLSRGGSRSSGDAIVVPYDLLAAMALRDVDDDADALDGGTFTALSPGLQRYSTWLASYAAGRFEAASKPVLLGLLQAGTPDELRDAIAAHPLLLDARVDALLGHIAEVAEQENQPQMAYIARARRELLADVRERGLDSALPPSSVHAPR